MANENLKKRLKAAKKDLLERKHCIEIEVENGKKELKRTKRKIKEVDRILEQM